MKKPKQKTNKNRQTVATISIKPKLLTLAIAQALAFQAVQAATIEVTSPLDDNGAGCTLREAIESVNAGSVGTSGCVASGVFGSSDQITFASSVSGNTITLNGNLLFINKGVSINQGGSKTTIDGNKSSPVFRLNGTSGITVALDHLIITQGNAKDYYGAGIDLFLGNNSSTLNVNNSIITGNTSNGKGGGVYAGEWNVFINNTTISGNTADNYGGGICVADHATLHMSDSTVSNNVARYGGGIHARSSSSLSVTNSDISGNSAMNNGGAIYATDSEVTLTDSAITGNTANYNGGAIGAYSSDVSLTGSEVTTNSAGTSGAILANNDSNISFNKSVVANNTAQVNAGIYAVNSSSIILEDSTVSGNSAPYAGGGIRAVGTSSIALINSTVSGNTALAGGIEAISSSVSLINSTISDNQGSNASEVLIIEDYYLGSSTLTSENTIIANLQAGPDCATYGTNMFSIGTNNIIKDDSCGTSAMNIDPGLLPLADNGGRTETHALMPGSSAIDAGDNRTCESEDQRGQARDDGACDIGAYEFNGRTIPIFRKDRKFNSLLSDGEQWYLFKSGESQRLSLQTNGFSGDTELDLFLGHDPKTMISAISMDDDSGPELFSNIRHNVNGGFYLIRVNAKVTADPYFLRLMSDQDIVSFTDTSSHFASKEIRVMSSAGISGGCGMNKYCPTDPVTRAQMAIFMLKAIKGGNHNSPPATGTLFSDVSASSFGANFIEEFSTLGITSGCGGGNYCPDFAVTREQMAVFLLRSWYGSSYAPPVATPAEINQFNDIADSSVKDWIVQLTKEGITGGCGGGKFCPTDTVTRGQMAAFIARTFDLDVEL